MSILYNFITMTISGSIIYILFKAGMNITKNNFSAAWHYGILKCMLIFFLIPIGWINSYLYVSNNNSAATMSIHSSAYNKSMGVMNSVVEFTKAYYKWVLVTWLLGVAILTLKEFLSYMKFRYIVNIHKKEPSEVITNLVVECCINLDIKRPIQVYINEYVNTPMLIGLISPIILLPTDELDNQDAEYILNHELSHYKKKDLLFKFIMLSIRILHWFNPLVYIISKDLDKWCEYTCDEKNAIGLTLDMKKKYGLAILNAAASVPVYGTSFGTPLLMPQQNLKERLMFMLNVKRMNMNSVILSVVLTTFILFSGIVTAFAAEVEYVRIQQVIDSRDIYDSSLSMDFKKEQKNNHIQLEQVIGDIR